MSQPSHSPVDHTGDAAWSVAQVARAAKRMIEGGLGALWIKGEVCGLKVYQSGHWYFTLRDAEAQIRCTMWRSYAVKAGAPPAEGTQVFAFAAPTVWEERGEFRLNVLELLATEGMGLQHLAFERAKAALAKDGLFDPSRKRPLPPLPSRIAVVTSLDGAALRDIMTVTRRRWPSLQLVVVGAKVQGAEAEAELIRALGIVGRLTGIDLCVIGRGGGAREDLAAFNSESVCRALAALPVPSISAVGHETDISLTDLVADLRAATPSAAMELAVPDREELLARVAGLGHRLGGTLARSTRLTGERLARTADRLEAGMETLMERKRRQLERLTVQLDALSPLRVLERGYGMALDGDGRVLKHRADFEPGLRFNLRVADGAIAARVEERS
ncbi:MAG: exodeoxyribonuclease VII large subunit [Gemmatimonadota bacterium]